MAIDSRIIPAHAGNTSETLTPPPPLTDHPRARGEHCSTLPATKKAVGSSPRTRGTLRSPSHSRFSGRIIPAHAGNTWRNEHPPAAGSDHPRARGEHRCFCGLCICRLGSSPRTRGTQPLQHLPNLRVRIIPAHAGNTLPYVRKFVAITDHPRARGEHSSSSSEGSWSDGSSPRTRGTPLSKIQAKHIPRIIPAHAGNTSWAQASPGQSPDHPRARGEHIRGAAIAKPPPGSSPRTRGTLAQHFLDF